MSNFEIDYLAYYWPAKSDIPVARVAELREAISLLIAQTSPDIDTSPGTVFGDLHVSPAAWDKAAAEIAWKRFAEDLDPINAVNGVVWNCDFVRAYLRAFGQDTVEPTPWAILRLTFTSNAAVELDRSIKFRVGQSDFQMHLPYDGPLYLNGTPAPGENHKTLVRVGDNRWVVDIMIEGEAGASELSTSVTLDQTVEALASATLLHRIQAGLEPTSLQETARRLRTLTNSRQPVTRTGATGMVTTKFPDITSVSAVLSGDAEQIRDSLNPLLMPGGKLDICVKSATLVDNTMLVRLARSGTATPFYSGMLEFPSVAVGISSVTYGGAVVDWELIQIPTEDFPGLTSAYTKYQQLFLKIDATGIPGVLIEDVLYADFTVTWQLDPALVAVVEWLESDDNKTAGVDILPRWFTPYRIDFLDVWYHRKSGVVFDRDLARAELLSTFNLHCPDSPAGAHRIGDSMYWAGAHSVQRLEFEATLQPSLATKWLDGEFVQPESDGDWTAFDALLVEVPTNVESDIVNFDPTFVDLTSKVSVGARNFSWLLTNPNLHLIERGSI